MHQNRLSISSSNSTPQFSSLSTANNQSSSSTPLAFTLNLQSPNAHSSSYTSQQSQTTSSQNPVKPANNSSNNNNQTPKATQQQQQAATNSLQNQPAVLFSAASISPPNSPKTIGPNVFDEVVYNLQLDYWTNIFSNLISSLESSSQPQQCVNQQMIQSNSSSQKITLKAWFKILNVFRTQLIMPNTSGLASDLAQSLTLVYQIKEKKQKSKIVIN